MVLRSLPLNRSLFLRTMCAPFANASFLGKIQPLHHNARFRTCTHAHTHALSLTSLSTSLSTSLHLSHLFRPPSLTGTHNPTRSDERLVFCHRGCGNSVHANCMYEWAKHAKSQGEAEVSAHCRLPQVAVSSCRRGQGGGDGSGGAVKKTKCQHTCMSTPVLCTSCTLSNAVPPPLSPPLPTDNLSPQIAEHQVSSVQVDLW